MKCQNMLSNDDEISEIQTYLQKCHKTFLKTSKNRIDCFTSNIHFIFLSLGTYWIFQQEEFFLF